jgi:hypothetical protein
VGLPPSPVEFSSPATFTSFLTPDCWAFAAAPALASVFVFSSRGRWVSPLSCGVFLPPPLSQAFLLPPIQNISTEVFKKVYIYYNDESNSFCFSLYIYIKISLNINV